MPGLSIPCYASTTSTDRFLNVCWLLAPPRYCAGEDLRQREPHIAMLFEHFELIAGGSDQDMPSEIV